MTAAVPKDGAPRGLYAIIDHAVHGSEALASACRDVQAAGAVWIQLRCKEVDDRTFHDCVRSCVESVRAPESVLWINDRVDLAALFPVRGVHLGQNDLPPSEARRLLGPEVLIGRSCHDLDQVTQADRDTAVDIVAVGPVFATTSKKNPEATVGLDGLQKSRGRTDKPLVAIGGIDAEHYRRVRRCGADLVAVIGALGRGSDLLANCRALLALEGPQIADGREPNLPPPAS